MSIFKAILDSVPQAMAQRRALKNIQRASDAEFLTTARSAGLKRPKAPPGTPMFRAWRKCVAKAAVAAQFNENEASERAAADADFIAWTGCLPTHNDILDGFQLRWAKTAEMLADLGFRDEIEKSLEGIKEGMMRMPESVFSDFQRDLKIIPITHPDFEQAQELLKACESVQRARLTRD
jgi:hypothetical protein